MILLVTYDLKTPGRTYGPFYEALKAQGSWWHYLTTTWLLDTEHQPQEVYDALGQHLSKLDRILVIRVTNSYQGYLPKDAWDWINARTFQ
jgi:hypothetical protein